MNDEDMVCGEAKEICLVVRFCPRDGTGWSLPCSFCLILLSILDRKTLQMYAMLEKKNPFSQEIM